MCLNEQRSHCIHDFAHTFASGVFAVFPQKFRFAAHHAQGLCKMYQPKKKKWKRTDACIDKDDGTSQHFPAIWSFDGHCWARSLMLANLGNRLTQSRFDLFSAPTWLRQIGDVDGWRRRFAKFAVDELSFTFAEHCVEAGAFYTTKTGLVVGNWLRTIYKKMLQLFLMGSRLPDRVPHPRSM